LLLGKDLLVSGSGLRKCAVPQQVIARRHEFFNGVLALRRHNKEKRGIENDIMKTKVVFFIKTLPF